MDELKDTNNIRCRWSDDVETKECRFDCFDPVSDLSPAIGGLARDSRMIGLVSGLYGEPAHLFKDKLIYKPPNAKGYNLHQDYISWPSFPKTFVTAIVAIDPSSAGNGATEVFRGYHQKGGLTPLDGNYHQLPEDAVDAATGVMLDLEPGDVAVFSGFTPHRSGPNRSPNWRRLLYLSYNAASDGGDRPDRALWEIYVFHEDLEDDDHDHGDSMQTSTSGQQDARDAGEATGKANAQSPAPALTWGHRLSEDVPARIPYDDNSVQEILSKSAAASAFLFLKPGEVSKPEEVTKPEPAAAAATGGKQIRLVTSADCCS